jgi:hypothetical protein
VLGRPESRRSYDAELSLASRRAASPRPRSSAPNRSSPNHTPPTRPAPVEVDEDDVILSPIAAFLLRRGPIIVVLFLALGLFVGTALADKRPRQPAQSPTPTVVCANPATCGGGG